MLELATFVLAITVCEIDFFPNGLEFECLTLKMKVKDVDDLDGNMQAKVSCQPAYVCKKWRL